MRRVLTVLFIAIGALILLAAPAAADWKVGDGHKMHWPQLPDNNGWDIDMSNFVLADDWQCSETGMVDDIHFWFSVEHQTSADPANPPFLGNIQVSIHNNVPKGVDSPFSHPGTRLRQWTFDPTQYKIAGPWPGDQGWDSPLPGTICIRPDHIWFWQVNITNIGETVTDPFRQQKDAIYWLDLQIPQADPVVGWKTTLDPFLDDAVYATAAAPGWQPVAVCQEDMPTDFAFVITPEPSTVVMLVSAGLAGLLALVRYRRRR